MARPVNEFFRLSPINLSEVKDILVTRAATISVVPSFLRPYLKRIETSPTASRLLRGAFWSLSGALISRVLGLISSFVVARILGKSGFGELGIIQSTVGM